VNWPPTYLQWFLIVALPLMGVVYAFLGGIKISLTERLQLDEAKVGGLVAGFGMMVGPTILGCGFLTDAIGRKWVFIPGASIVVMALVILATTRSYRGAALGALLLGAGWSATINVGNVLMGEAGDPGKMTQRMQFTDFLFGLGAFLTPMVIGVLLRKTGYSRTIFILAALSAIPILMGLPAVMDTAHAAGRAEGTLGQLFSGRIFWMTSLAFLFYVPLESSVAGWATTIVTRQAQQGVDGGRLASISLMAFWLCFTGSRLVVAIVGVEQGRDVLLLCLSLAAVAVMGGIIFLPGQWTAMGLILAAGLVFGPTFPILIAKILSTAPKGVEGRAVGFFFAFGSVGWTFIPRFIGHVAARTNIQRGFMVAGASSVIFLGLVLAQFLLRGATAGH
jgi:fucose permease